MVQQWVTALATSIGLLTDKYMLEATNYVEHYAVHLKPSADEKEIIKSSMYAGAIVGMIVFGPLSDIIGRRAGLLACSVITLSGAVLSMCAWSAEVLILARIITGIGMGGEYPLASTHSAESGKAGEGARNVAILYLIGSGGGPVLCSIVTLVLESSPLPDHLVWRGIFMVGCILSLAGLILRFLTTQNSPQFNKAAQHAKSARGTRRKFFKEYWRPLLGTATIWMLFDIVEYGLKQNDAAIFAEDSDGPYRDSIIKIGVSRVLVIPSLVLAPWLLTKISSKMVQMIGFVGCCLFNFLLAIAYKELSSHWTVFLLVYILQLSFQSLPGVSTMAISAEIYPSAVKGTAAAISAASGKIGATFGSFYFTYLKDHHHIEQIFWTVTCTSTVALLLTIVLIPTYNGATLALAEELAEEGKTKEARRMLYSGPQRDDKSRKEDGMESSEDSLDSSGGATNTESDC
jgi:PHS family inorganic phosphate transporter-like MFS transporter